MLSHLINHLLILLLCALAVLSFFTKAGIPSSVGYMVVGILLGPYLLNIFPYSEGTASLAEIGIVLLMFTVGLEFSFSKLLETKRAVFYTGGIQTIALFLMAGSVLYYWKLSILQALLLGGAIAMSSTAIVAKQLANLGELHTESSRLTIGVLLFQDLATLPFLIILSTSTEINNSHQLILTLLRTLPINLLALVAFFIAGRWVLKPFIHYMAHLRSAELFMLTALTVLIFTAWIAAQLGIAMPLGAFVVGMVLGETALKNQLEEDLRPFRDILVGVFFISIGTQFNPKIFSHEWILTLLIVVGIIFGKTVISILSGLVTKHSLYNSVKAAIALAHTGEFGLLILTSAMERRLFEPALGQAFLTAIIISIFFSPFFIQYQNEIVSRLLKIKKLTSAQLEKSIPELSAAKNHIIICGFGEVGANLSQWLTLEKISFTIIDYDIGQVQLAHSLGYSAIYGDATRLGILQKAGLEQSAAVAVTLTSQSQVYKIAHAVKTSRSNRLVIARAKDMHSVEKLRDIKIDIIFPEAMEVSLMFGRKLFSALGYSADKIESSLNSLRKNKINDLSVLA